MSNAVALTRAGVAVGKQLLTLFPDTEAAEQMIRFAFIVVTTALILIAGGCAETGDSASNGLYAERITPQSDVGRTWADISLRRLHDLPRDTNAVLLVPAFVRVDGNSHVYVADQGVMQIKRFDEHGDFVNTIGAGVGEGPGEFILLFDAQVHADTMVSVLDFTARRVSTFDLSGTFLGSERTGPPLLRRQMAHDGTAYGLVITSNALQEDTPLIEARRNDKVVRFGALLAEQEYPTNILDSGYIVTTGNDMVYVSSWFPVLLRYAPDGSLVYARGSIAFGKVDEPTAIWDPGVSLRPDGRGVHTSVSVDGDNLYVNDRETSSLSVDVYDIENGNYKYSISLWEDRDKAHFGNGRLYRVRDTTVTVYEYTISF